MPLMPHNTSRAKLGRAAELLVEAKCHFNGLACYVPTSGHEPVDLLLGPHAYRCQVKVLGHIAADDPRRYLPLVKCGGRRGARSRFRYSPTDVDFMIGVNIETFAVYIAPIGSLDGWERCVSEATLERLGTKEAFHLLKAAPGETGAREESAPDRAPRAPKRRRPSRAWKDTSSLPLGLELHDDAPLVRSHDVTSMALFASHAASHAAR